MGIGSRSDEEEAKARFVGNRLARMLAAATDCFVESCEYDPESEEVAVFFGESGGWRVVRVNVACDSRWAIAKDVMAAVAGEYE